MSAAFIPAGPRSHKVKCTVCGRKGYNSGDPWADACWAGHPFSCGTCGRRFANLSGWAQHKRRTGHGGAA